MPIFSKPTPNRLRSVVLCAFATWLAAAGPGVMAARAQEPVAPLTRSPDYLREVIQLAGILGGAHGIRSVCSNETDGFWRTRMISMLALEAPDPGPLRRSMVEAFNRAWEFETARHPDCTQDALAAETAYAAQGIELTGSIARALLPRRAGAPETP